MLEVAHIGQGGQRWDLRGQSGVVKVRAPAVSRHIFSKWGGWGDGGEWEGSGRGVEVRVEGEWEGSGRRWGMMCGYAHACTGHTECKCEAHERHSMRTTCTHQKGNGLKESEHHIHLL